MSSTLSPEAVPTARIAHLVVASPKATPRPQSFRAPDGSPAHRLLNTVTERDIQEILDVLLLNAKGAICRVSIPVLVCDRQTEAGRGARPARSPGDADVARGRLAARSAGTLCGQLPLDFQVQLTRFTQSTTRPPPSSPRSRPNPSRPRRTHPTERPVK